MTKNNLLRTLALTAAIVIPTLANAQQTTDTQAGAKKDDAGHFQVPLQIKKNIKAVYQISDDKVKNDLARSLTYAEKLLDTYNANGIADEQVDLHLVFHGHGTNALVNKETRTKLEAAGPAENPNLKLIASLIKRGVKIELCESSMQQRDVTSKDLVEGIVTVVGAFPRLIELQMLDYSYIKFE